MVGRLRPVAVGCLDPGQSGGSVPTPCAWVGKAPPRPAGLCAPCPPACACGYGLLLYLRAKASRPPRGLACGTHVAVRSRLSLRALQGDGDWKRMEALILLLGLAVLAVPVLLVVALVMIGDLRRRVRELEDRTQRRPQEAQPRQAGPQTPDSAMSEPTTPEASMPAVPAPSLASAPKPPPEPKLSPRSAVAE